MISFEQNLKVYVFVMFKMKYLINRMSCNILSQKVRWLNGKGVCWPSKGQRIKPHGCVWSTMVCWSNILLSNSYNRWLGWLPTYLG
jgi:hypothetical protein